MKPFKFKLKKVGADEQRLIAALYEFLPNCIDCDSPEGVFGDLISKFIGERCELRLETVHRGTMNRFISAMPDPGSFTLVELAPISSQMVLELDAQLALAAIERILGGRVNSVPTPRPITDAEQGVLEYLILQILAGISEMGCSEAGVKLRMGNIFFHPSSVRDCFEDNPSAVSLSYRMSFCGVSGFVRLLIPDALIEEGMIGVGVSDGRAAKASKVRSMKRFSYLPLTLSAEAGCTVLSYDELNELEEGDVILFDDGDPALASDSLSGRVIVRVGDGLSGGLDATLSVDGVVAHCRIDGINNGEQL